LRGGETAGNISLIRHINKSMDQQHRKTFRALKDARGSYRPAIFIDNGFLVGVALKMLGGGAQSVFDR